MYEDITQNLHNKESNANADIIWNNSEVRDEQNLLRPVPPKQLQTFRGNPSSQDKIQSL